jgi:hypothetical protein
MAPTPSQSCSRGRFRMEISVSVDRLSRDPHLAAGDPVATVRARGRGVADVASS